MVAQSLRPPRQGHQHDQKTVLPGTRERSPVAHGVSAESCIVMFSPFGLHMSPPGPPLLSVGVSVLDIWCLLKFSSQVLYPEADLRGTREGRKATGLDQIDQQTDNGVESLTTYRALERVVSLNFSPPLDR